MPRVNFSTISFRTNNCKAHFYRISKNNGIGTTCMHFARNNKDTRSSINFNRNTSRRDIFSFFFLSLLVYFILWKTPGKRCFRTLKNILRRFIFKIMISGASANLIYDRIKDPVQTAESPTVDDTKGTLRKQVAVSSTIRRTP